MTTGFGRVLILIAAAASALASLLDHAAAVLTTTAISQNITFVGNATLCGVGACASPVSGLSLTPPLARVTGAAWTRSRVALANGFETTFTLTLSQQSNTCPQSNGILGVSRSCVTRGGSGLAFVVLDVNDSMTPIDTVIGAGETGMGYQGIQNSLAVEFDTWYDNELEDPYDNHIAIQSRGSAYPNSNHHQYALGTSTALPDFMDQKSHSIRIVYDPCFDSRFIDPTYCVDTSSCGLLQTMQNLGVLFAGGLLEWGLGTMAVYVDDVKVARVVAPVQLSTLLQLTNGTQGYMGFTASTGLTAWQVHEISDWRLCVYAPRTGNNNNPDTTMPTEQPYTTPKIQQCTQIT